jgi:squalene-hopene/tetraprenyl-beta-curcumene cyclase
MKSLLAPLSVALAVLAVPAHAAAQGTPAQAPNLQEEIRVSIRWLRSVQDPKDGSYGGGVEPTALAVRAFAQCPDRYRPADGPFVRRAVEFLLARQREDGAICDSNASEEACRDQTRLAVGALLPIASEDTAAPLAHALAFLGEKDLANADWDGTGEVSTLAQAQVLVAELLKSRDPAGFWEGKRGRVAETAEAVILLSKAHAVLSPAAPPGGAQARPAQALPAAQKADHQATLEAMRRGALFLASQADERGRFGAPGKPDAGITAMAIAALEALPAPRPAEVQRVVDKGLEWLVSLQREDGSIHDGKLANYITSASILALVRSGEERFRPAIARAQGFLAGLQADEGEGYSEGDLYYGGIGYGSTERPDLSNLQMALEALAASGLPSDAPTYKKALRFLERCQNRSESNTLRIAEGEAVIESGDDGGGVYAPGDSKAGFVELEGGVKVPRSYGSMTYALLKCFVFAGLPKDDPRMKAAFDWCQKNYTLDVNPGFEGSSDPAAAYQGLFYYFYTMAHALEAYGADAIVDAAGERHDWRAELAGRLVAMQSKADGSWVNANSPRWYEGNPLLASAYALLALRSTLAEAR